MIRNRVYSCIGPGFALCRVNSNTGTMALYVGGNYSDNANYGFFYFNANNSATNTNSNRGSRLLL